MTGSQATDSRIDPALYEFISLDAVPIATAILSAVTLSVLGATLVLRRRAMIGDALAHSVLPGIVIAFLVTGSRALGPMFLGALAAALGTAAMIGALTRLARTEATTAIGIVFTTMFALGVVLVESTGARNVDLDLDCVLSGQLELLYWDAPRTWDQLLSVGALASLPRELTGVLSTLILVAVFSVCASGPMRAATFDAPYARVRGGAPGALHAAHLGLTSLALVASFEALGSILVIALLVGPAAAARLITKRYGAYFVCTALLGAFVATAGYAVAAWIAPATIGFNLDASGTIATLSGLVVLVTALAKRDSLER